VEDMISTTNELLQPNPGMQLTSTVCFTFFYESNQNDFHACLPDSEHMSIHPTWNSLPRTVTDNNSLGTF